VGKLRGVTVNTPKDIIALYKIWNLIKLPCSQQPARSILNKNDLSHTPILFL